MPGITMKSRGMVRVLINATCNGWRFQFITILKGLFVSEGVQKSLPIRGIFYRLVVIAYRKIVNQCRTGMQHVV
jgi:hypothetical protein